VTPEELGDLHAAYGADWLIRVTNSKAAATRRRSLSDEEIAAGMAMTLYDGDGGSLAQLLFAQQRLEDELTEAGLRT
jgi:hypothetical protein